MLRLARACVPALDILHGSDAEMQARAAIVILSLNHEISCLPLAKRHVVGFLRSIGYTALSFKVDVFTEDLSARVLVPVACQNPRAVPPKSPFIGVNEEFEMTVRRSDTLRIGQIGLGHSKDGAAKFCSKNTIVKTARHCDSTDEGIPHASFMRPRLALRYILSVDRALRIGQMTAIQRAIPRLSCVMQY